MRPRLSLTLGCLLATTPIMAQRSAFVATLGADTTAVEQYTRSGNTITGDLVTRLGGTVVNHYVLTLNSDGTPATLVVTPRRADGSMIANGYASATATLTGDTLSTVMAIRDTSMRRVVSVTPGSGRLLPTAGGGLSPSMAAYEALFANLRATHTDSAAFFAIATGVTRAGVPSWAKVFGADSARIWIRFAPPTPAGPYPQYVRIDATGRILGFSGRETTIKVEVKRVESLDIATMAKAFAAAEAEGRGLTGAVSASDSVRATIGGAHVGVKYSRPRARGRDVFRNGVLGDTIWRTGANTATSFTTDRDLVVEGKTIPAGSYTLWTHVAPNNSRYELIFNKFSGWGTDYHSDQDLVRVPLAVSALASPVELFTIGVEAQAGGSSGVIKLLWATTQLAVPFAIK